MAQLSSGESAAKILRYLRGCGQACICERLCASCSSETDCGPEIAVVDQVLPGVIVLSDGRRFPRPGGGTPRPGAQVVIDCAPGIIYRSQQSPVPVTGRRLTWTGAAAELDAWQRPVTLGSRALGVATESGPVVVGERDEPAEVQPGRGVLSYIEQHYRYEPENLTPNLSVTPLQGVWQITPVALSRTASNPGVITENFADFTTSVPSELPDRYVEDSTRSDHPDDWRTLRFRLTTGMQLAEGEATGAVQTAPIDNPDALVDSDETISRMVSQTVPRVLVQSDRAISGLFVEWYVPNLIPEEWTQQREQDPSAQIPLPARLLVKMQDGSEGRWEPFRQLSTRGAWRAEFDGDVIEGTGDSGNSERARIMWSSGAPATFVPPVWNGQHRTGQRARDRSVAQLPVSELYTTLLGADPVNGLARNPLTVEADLPGLGRFEVLAPDESLTSGPHRDHLVGGATMRLNGATITGTSWSILRRRGGELNLLTLSGSTLTVRRPSGTHNISLQQLIVDWCDANERPAPGQVEWLESNLREPEHTDHLRVIAGDRAWIVTGFDTFRDLPPGERPPRIEGLTAEDREQDAPDHGLSVVAEVPGPTPDTAGLPRYGPDPKLRLHDAPLVRWPWASRALQDVDDERGTGEEVVQPAELTFPDNKPVAIVGRARGGEPDGTWTWSSFYEGGHGWRPFVAVFPDGSPASLSLDADIEHIAAYIPFESSISG